MVTSWGGESLHQIDPVFKMSLWLCCVFPMRSPSALTGERWALPSTACSPLSSAGSPPGQGQCIGRMATWPSAQNRTIAGAGAAPAGVRAWCTSAWRRVCVRVKHPRLSGAACGRGWGSGSGSGLHPLCFHYSVPECRSHTPPPHPAGLVCTAHVDDPGSVSRGNC